MKKRDTALIVEMLLLFVLLLIVIVTVTRVFVTARGQSLTARRLTGAVCLAENIAEAAHSAPDAESVPEILHGLDGVRDLQETEDGILLTIRQTGAKASTDVYRARLTLTEEPGEAGTLLSGTVEMYFGDDAEPLYTLETGSYRMAAGRKGVSP